TVLDAKLITEYGFIRNTGHVPFLIECAQRPVDRYPFRRLKRMLYFRERKGHVLVLQHFVYQYPHCGGLDTFAHQFIFDILLHDQLPFTTSSPSTDNNEDNGSPTAVAVASSSSYKDKRFQEPVVQQSRYLLSESLRQIGRAHV